MSEQVLYRFEELSEDLPRPPLAAQRALLLSGFIISPRGWQQLPPALRRELAVQGTRADVDRAEVRQLVERVPPKFLKLVSRSRDPDPDQVPAALAKNLGPGRVLSVAQWKALRPLDRYVLASLANNSRLLCRAFDELGASNGWTGAAPRWSGVVARAEIRMHEAALAQLTSHSLHEGRALMLARVAGIRAARAVGQTLDLHADVDCGPVELDFAVEREHDAVLWQAHVSTWDGEFFPAASMIAVFTAAAAVFDLVKDFDPSATIVSSGVREEAWRVGGSGFPEEEATAVYGAVRFVVQQQQEAAAKTQVSLPAPEPAPEPEPEPVKLVDVRASEPPSDGVVELAGARDSEPVVLPVSRMPLVLLAVAGGLFVLSVGMLIYVLAQ